MHLQISANQRFVDAFTEKLVKNVCMLRGSIWTCMLINKNVWSEYKIF